jgi:hypothetical protein
MLNGPNIWSMLSAFFLRTRVGGVVEPLPHHHQRQRRESGDTLCQCLTMCLETRAQMCTVCVSVYLQMCTLCVTVYMGLVFSV